MTWDRLLDLFYPRSCAGCGGAVDGEFHHLCWDCASAVPYVGPPYCSLCGDPVDGKVDGDFVCYFCSSHERFFDGARSAARYRGVLKDVLRRFKYDSALWVRSDLVRLLDACTRAHFDPDAIDAVCAVPLYPVKRRLRSFNQSQLLARSLARRLRKPLLSRCLVRVKPTPSQTNLTARQRATNVRDAFRTRNRRRLAGRSVLLVDDIMTTGATVSECARTLKQGGAAKVYVVTVARG